MRLKHKINNAILFFGVFIFFFFFYVFIHKNLPITFYDESLWLGKSYFFDLLVNEGTHNILWQSVYSYDEPKLAELTFGAIIYPLYLTQRNSSESYIRYLSKNHLLCDACISSEYLPSNATVTNYETFQNNIYSPDYSNTRHIIYIIRLFNICISALTVVVVVVIGNLLWKNKFFGILLGLLYGFNSLVINTSLVAHADAMFFFFFIMSLLSLHKYLISPKFIYVLFFSILTGYTASTKIIGFVLLLPFSILQIKQLLKQPVSNKNLVSIISVSVLVSLLSLLIFIVINPYLHQNTLQRFRQIFTWRMEQTKQSSHRDEPSALNTPTDRAVSIFNRYFIDDTYLYSAPYRIKRQKGYFNYIYLNFFIVGILSYIYKILRNQIKENALYYLFVGILMFISMLWWLMVAWDRYYLFLTLPVLVIQTEGVIFTLKFIRLGLKRLSHLNQTRSMFRKQIY